MRRCANNPSILITMVTLWLTPIGLPLSHSD
jgi:hypothetical protein